MIAVLRTYMQFYLAAITLIYASLLLITHVIVFPATTIFSRHELAHQYFPSVAIFSFWWALVMISIYFLLSYRAKVKFTDLFLHMGVISMLGPVCEVAINTFCRFLFHSSLWTYHFFPVHGGDTSLYSFCVWAMYGCHLYFVDKAFIKESTLYRTVVFAMVLSVDAILLEVILNITSIYALHTYIFYYLPNDMHHLSTIAVMPFYFLGGLVASETIRLFMRAPLISGLLSFVAGFLFVFYG